MPEALVHVRRSRLAPRWLIKCQLCAVPAVGHAKTPGEAGDEGRHHLRTRHGIDA